MADPPQKKKEEDFYFGRVIGEGAFSTVYLCKEVNNQKEYAIKVCNKNLIMREKKTKAIMREKEAMLKLLSEWSPTAPYFVRLYATFKNEENLYFVLSYAKRGDMLKFIKKMAAKEVDVTQFYAAELVQAIEHLHRLNIIHRDLKPENILLSSDMHILVTDFGSAKIISEAEDECESSTVSGLEGPATVRRNSFVGTAQYVSPEILTNSGSSKASDLWALGCIIYQMVTGIPPFQAQNEYLIFQKVSCYNHITSSTIFMIFFQIQNLEYSFHDGFDSVARDLVEKLLVINPQSRLGAGDSPGDYCSLKSHPFFHSINFHSLHNTTPPHIQPFVGDPHQEDPIWSRHPDMGPGMGTTEMSRILRDQIGDSSREDSDLELEDGDDVSLNSEGSCIPPSGNIGDLSDLERSRLLDKQSKTNEFHQFVEGNLILKQGILNKKKGLWSRRRMFLLTEGPRLFYVDPKEKVLKGEIPWSHDMKTEMKNFQIFFVHTPNRVYYLIDPTSYAAKWCEAIDCVKQFYFHKKDS